jgi:hypothetical protein
MLAQLRRLQGLLAAPAGGVAEGGLRGVRYVDLLDRDLHPQFLVLGQPYAAPTAGTQPLPQPVPPGDDLLPLPCHQRLSPRPYARHLTERPAMLTPSVREPSRKRRRTTVAD